MVEGGAAKAVLGNHETNALAYATPKSATHAPLHAPAVHAGLAM
jgi:hypothetical protein